MDAPNNQGQQAGQSPPPVPAPGSQPPTLSVPPLVVPSIGAAPALPPQMAAMQGMAPQMNMFPANMAQYRPAMMQHLQTQTATMAQQHAQLQQAQQQALQNSTMAMAQQQAKLQQQQQQRQQQQQQAARAHSGSAPNSSMSQPIPVHTQATSAPTAAPRAAPTASASGPAPTLENINFLLDQHIAGLPPQLPPGQQVFLWPLQNGLASRMPREFFETYRGVWKAYHSKDPRFANYLAHAYSQWTQRQAAKSTAAAAGGAVRPQAAQTNPAPRPPVKPRVQQADVHERGKASTAELQKKRDAQKQEGSAALAGAFPSIVAPRNGEDQAFLPLPRLRSLVKETCGPTAKLTPEGEGAMKALADDFVSGAIGFAVDMAKRKKARKLDPADLALYFKRTWNIDVPGLNQGQVAPYRRITPSDAHRSRLAAVRKANIAGGGGGGGRVGGNRGGATAAQSPAVGGSVGISVSPATKTAAAATAATAEAAGGAERKGKAPMREPVQMEDGGEDEDMPDVF